MKTLYENRLVNPQCRTIEQVAAEVELGWLTQRKRKQTPGTRSGSNENWSQILEIQRKRLALLAS